MADLPSIEAKINDLEVAANAPVSEQLMRKIGSDINSLIDEQGTQDSTIAANAALLVNFTHLRGDFASATNSGSQTSVGTTDLAIDASFITKGRPTLFIVQSGTINVTGGGSGNGFVRIIRNGAPVGDIWTDSEGLVTYRNVIGVIDTPGTGTQDYKLRLERTGGIGIYGPVVTSLKILAIQM